MPGTINGLSRTKARQAVLMCVCLPLILAAGLGFPGTSVAAAPDVPRMAPPRALVLEPFASELGDAAGPGQDIAGALRGAGFDVTVLSDGRVTVPQMLHLSRYAFIYISTHAGPLPNEDAAVATGDTRHHVYTRYLTNYSLAEMRIPRRGVETYFDAVTGRFIHRYDGIFPAHTVVFLNACNALDMPMFWHYLQESGVGTLISWHHHVTAADADRAAESMFSGLAAGESVSQALSDTAAAGEATSVVKRKTGSLSFFGDGAYTLADSFGVEDPNLPGRGRKPVPWPPRSIDRSSFIR